MCKQVVSFRMYVHTHTHTVQARVRVVPRILAPFRCVWTQKFACCCGLPPYCCCISSKRLWGNIQRPGAFNLLAQHHTPGSALLRAVWRGLLFRVAVRRGVPWWDHRRPQVTGSRLGFVWQARGVRERIGTLRKKSRHLNNTLNSSISCDGIL